MVKIVPANLAPDAYPRIRGAVLTRPWRGIMIAMKWPKKRGTPTNPKVIWTSKQFSYASQMAANSEPMQMETARFLSQGTVWLPRDLLVRAAFGNVYELVLPDGSIAPIADHGPPPSIEPPIPWLIAAQSTPVTNNGGWNNYTVRQRIAPTAILANEALWRVTFRAAPTTSGAGISKAYIGQGASSGHAYDFAGPPAQLTFGGSPSVSIPVGTEITSDAVPFALSGGQPLLISWWSTGTSSYASQNPLADWQTYYRIGDFADVVDTSGFTTYQSVIGVSLIETQTP